MDADVEISKPGESSHSVAAKDVKITTTIDTLVKGMLIFHHDGEAGISMWVSPDAQDGRGAVIILKTLVWYCKQSNSGLFDLDIAEAELREKVGKELLKVKKLNIRENQIVDVSPLAGLVNLTYLRLDRNPIVDTSPLRSLPLKTKIEGVSVCCRCCTIV